MALISRQPLYLIFRFRGGGEGGTLKALPEDERVADWKVQTGVGGLIDHRRDRDSWNSEPTSTKRYAYIPHS